MSASPERQDAPEETAPEGADVPGEAAQAPVYERGTQFGDLFPDLDSEAWMDYNDWLVAASSSIWTPPEEEDEEMYA